MQTALVTKIKYMLSALSLVFFLSGCAGIEIRVFPGDIIHAENAKVILSYEATKCISFISCSHHMNILGGGSWEMDKKVIVVKPDEVTSKYVKFSGIKSTLSRPGQYVLQSITLSYDNYSYDIEAQDEKDYDPLKEDNIRRETMLKAKYSRNLYSSTAYGDIKTGGDIRIAADDQTPYSAVVYGGDKITVDDILSNSTYKRVPFRIQYDKSICASSCGDKLSLPFSRIGRIDINFTDEYSFKGDPREACALMPDDPEACVVSGKAYSRSKKYQEAITSFTRAIESMPHYGMAYLQRGHVFTLTKKYDEAVKDYTSAIERMDNFSEEARLSRGNTYAALGKHQEAIEDYLKIVESKPDYAEAYYNMGNSYSALKTHQKAIECYTLAIKYKPNHDRAYFNRGNSYLKSHNYQAAINDYSISIQLMPDSANCYFNRGLAYDVFGNKQLARRDFERAIELDPSLKSRLNSL